MTRPQLKRLIVRLNALLDPVERAGMEAIRRADGDAALVAEARRLAAALLAESADTPNEAAAVNKTLRRLFRLGVFNAPPLSGTPYDAWRRLCEPPASLPAGNGPPLSLIMPVYNPRPAFLEAALMSVRGQTDPHWELCVADDASTDPGIGTILRRHMAEDPRIRVVFREHNGHISAASNTALDMARGEWCGFVDHDDILSPQAVALTRQTLAAHPDAAVLFTDEDRLETEDASNAASGAARRTSPFFKPGFDPDLLLACNAVNHFGVYRTSLIRRLGGFREGLEGAQDHDLALRCLLAAGAEAFIHLPSVLYHWRMHENSTARAISAKPYAREAGLKARQAFVDGWRAAPKGDAPASDPPLAGVRPTIRPDIRPPIQQEASIQLTMLPDSGFANVRFRLPAPAPLVTLIVAPWDALPTAPGARPAEAAPPADDKRAADAAGLSMAGRVARLLERLPFAKREVLILAPEKDELSAYGRALQRAVSRLAAGMGIRLIATPGDQSLAETANQAVALARGAIVGLIRAGDLPVQPDWDTVAAACWRRGVAVAGCRGVTERGFLTHAGYAVGHGPDAGLWLCPAYAGLHTAARGYYAQAHLLHSVPALPLAGFFCRADVWRELGGLDPAAGELADADFCLRAWRDGKGRSVIVPGADLLTEAPLSPQPVCGAFARRWEHLLDQAPPFQSIHLSWTPGGWRLRPRRSANA